VTKHERRRPRATPRKKCRETYFVTKQLPPDLQAAAKADRLIARAGGMRTRHIAFAVNLGLDDVRLRPPITPAYLREMSFSDLFAPSSFGDDDTCTDQAPAAGAAAGFSSAASQYNLFQRLRGRFARLGCASGDLLGA
jgi:hypothetical protein